MWEYSRILGVLTQCGSTPTLEYSHIVGAFPQLYSHNVGVGVWAGVGRAGVGVASPTALVDICQKKQPHGRCSGSFSKCDRARSGLESVRAPSSPTMSSFDDLIGPAVSAWKSDGKTAFNDKAHVEPTCHAH
jgi:hypothetical protein